MTNGIIEYLGTQRASFSEVPLTEVDSLVLSTIVYLNFDKGTLGATVPSESVALPVALCGVERSELIDRMWLARMGGDEFILALLQSPRFMELRVGYFVNEVSSHFEKQFCAITFFFPDGSVYVAFRGTDNTLAGWKEDFNITFMKETPSQISARTYLEDIADVARQAGASLNVGGHSKGGNLAEYAALTCRQQTFDLVERIFNHDGPGFAFRVSDRIDEAAYNAKLRKTVPESSVFGMLMETRENYRIVKSTGFLFAQHAATHWEVSDGQFAGAERISPEAEVIFGTLNKWAHTYEPSQRELFIDTVYKLFCATNAESWGEMNDHLSMNARAIVEAVAGLSPTMRSTLLGMFRDVANILGNEALRHVLSALAKKG